MYYLIIALPLISAIFSGLFGRWLGEKGAGLITSLIIIITSIISWIAFYEVGLCGSSVYLNLWKWIDSGLLKVSFGFMFDSITVVMLSLVSTVSALVHLYSIEYMHNDPHLPRFMSYLSLFTFFMIILVTADNLLQLFIGWEGVGLCSYLLINFWFTRIQANKAAIKAMIVNRIGDLGVLLSLFLIFLLFKTLDFATIFSLCPKFSTYSYVITPEFSLYSREMDTINLQNSGIEIHALSLIGILLLVGAIGKSAQLGLHTWLPDAMEGPTPVSALIHAATMVTAGIFLIIRFGPLLEFAPKALIIIVIIGALTAFFAASIGLVQNDIKKVIAYSTCSQLGYMALACGLSNYSVSLFHLFNHGFFKALLFLSAGAIIHSMLDEQDMRKLGALIKSIPYTYIMILIGSLSLMGFPFLSGYYSKDAILEFAYGHYTFQGSFAYWLGTISAFFTAFYSLRLIYLTFINYPKNSQTIHYSSIHESPYLMLFSLSILAFGSIFFGYLFKDALIGIGSTFYQGSIFLIPNHGEIFINSEFIHSIFKLIPVYFSILGALIAILIYYFSNKFGKIFTVIEKAPHSFSQRIISKTFPVIYTFLNNKWHFDFIYNKYITKPLLYFGHHYSYKLLDRGYIEILGPKGLTLLITNFSNLISNLQSGWIYNYAFSIFLFTIIYMLIPYTI